MIRLSFRMWRHSDVSENSPHQPQVYRCPFGGFVCWYEKNRVGRAVGKIIFVGPKFTCKGFGWPLKTKMEKSNHDSFGKLKSILKAPPIFLVALTPRYFFGVVFCRCCWRSLSSKLGGHLPKKNDKLRYIPKSKCFLKYLKGRRFLRYLAKQFRF